MEALNNVVGLKNGSVYEDITIFLSDENYSDGTRSVYLFAIKEFFQFMGKGNIETLTINDLHFEERDVVRFRNHLINNFEQSKGTVNKKVAALQSLYSFFERNQYHTKHNVNTQVFSIKKLKHKSKSYGYLSPEEVDAMISCVLNQVKGYEKSMLIKLATRTSLREDTLLNLNWSDISFSAENNCYFVNVIEGKTLKEMNQPISIELYNELLQIKNLKYYQRYKDDMIFHLQTNTISGMMATLRKELGITAERKIVFHSLRNFAANYIIDTTGDFKASQLQLGHSSINTQWNNYVNKQRDVSQSAGLLLDEKLDQDIFNKMSEDEMRALLNGTKNGIRTQLIRETVRLFGEKELIDDLSVNSIDINVKLG